MKTIKFLTIVAIMILSVNTGNAQEKEKIEKVVFETSITCAGCVNTIMSSLPLEKGIKDVKCDIETKKVTVTYKKGKTDAETLKRSIEKLGYTAKEVKEEKKEGKKE